MNKFFKTIVSVCILAIVGVVMTSCNSGDSDADITGTLKLERTTNSSKTFLDNGIEECQVVSYTDGDTTTIRTVNSKKTLSIRYLSIDTPESTAKYEKWGKAASVFNKKILSQATSVIVEAEGSSAEKDSNGSRYLGYIWYKTADSDTYRNLNLEMVENGYSTNNCDVNGKYYTYFDKAEKKAMKEKLHVFSDKSTVDMYYSEDKQKVTVKQLNENSYYDSEKEIPTCVEFEAYVISVSGSSYLTSTVEQYDPVTKKYYNYTVDIGYDTALSRVLAVGNYAKIVGWTTGEGSIHGLTTDLTCPNDSPLYTTLKTKGYYNSFSNVVISSASVSNGVATLTGTYDNKEITLKLEDSTITEATLQQYVKTLKTVKCFKTTTDNVYTINTLSDLVK